LKLSAIQRTARRPLALGAALAAISLTAVALAGFHFGWILRAQPRVYYDVMNYGARADGVAKDTAPIQAAIDAAAAHGGGVVLVPPGTYLSGTLHLKSNVSLRVSTGATLIASRDDADFDPYETPAVGSVTIARLTWKLLPQLRRTMAVGRPTTTAFETVDDPDTTYAHYALIVADHVSNVTIDGFGIIDGNRNRRGGPKLIAMKNCRHVAVRDITLRNAPNYNISLIGTEDADLENLKIINGYADGIDPDNSRYVRIANCYIDTWDDAICVKASLALGHRLVTENIVITNCILRTSNAGFKFGTESEGDLRNVTFSNCLVLRRAHGRAPITGVAIESVDGGKVSGVVISNVVMRGVRTPIFLRLGNRGRGMAVSYPGWISDVTISDVTALDAVNPSSINGLPGFPIRDVSLANIDVQEVGGGAFPGLTVPELPRAYPQGEMFGRLPAYSLYARHVAGLMVSNWHGRWGRKDMRPAALFDDVRELQIFGFSAGAVGGSQPLLLMRNVDHARIESISVDQPGALLLRAEGPRTSGIAVLRGDESHSVGSDFEVYEDAHRPWSGESHLARDESSNALKRVGRALPLTR
jgi:Glycosyl hydrolases family 28